MSRALDNRRVKDVRPRHMPKPEDFDGDEQLAAYGFIGEPSTYRLRLSRIHALARDDKGPGAFLTRFLAACGYTS